MRKLIVLGTVVAALAVAALASAAGTVVIQPSNLQGWFVVASNNASATFVSGPGTAPAGEGSLQLDTSSGPGGKPRALSGFGEGFIGTKLADLGTLEYSAYISDYADGSSHLTVTLNVIVDLDGGEPDLGDTRTLVFEPCYTTSCGVPIQPLNTWTEFNALAAGTIWYATSQIGVNPANTFLELDDLVLTAFPDAIVLQVIVQAGQQNGGAPWDNFVGNADKLVVGDTTYDFEPEDVPPDTTSPVCSFSPDSKQKPVTGNLEQIQSTISWSDDMDPAPVVTYLGFTSSDSQGNVKNVQIGAGPGTATMTAQYKATSMAAWRKYILTFQVTDASGNTGSCTFSVKVVP